MPKRRNSDPLLSLPLTGPCVSCGAPEAVSLGGRAEHYCPTCHTRIVMYDAAEEHLYALLEPVVQVWARHTLHLLTPTHLSEVLSFVQPRLERLLEAEAQRSTRALERQSELEGLEQRR